MTTMDATRDQLRATVADFFGVDASGVGASFPLSGRLGGTSIARAALDAAIRRRVGRKSSAVYTAATLGQIEAELFPDAELNGDGPVAAIAPPDPAPASTSARGGVSIGIDIESVDALPEADDCWEHPFYRASFTPAEIAYCVAQASPRAHFAARWSAKEALRKCDRAFLSVPLDAVEVARDDAGAPTLRHRAGDAWRALPHALSLSHTNDAAVAVVVALAEPGRVAAVAEAPMPVADVPAPPPAAGRGFGRFVQAALLLTATAMSAWALYRTYAHGQ